MKKTKVLTANGEEILILLAALVIALGVALRAEAYPAYGMPGDRPDYEPEWIYAVDEYNADLDGYGEWRFVSSVGVQLWFPFVEVSWRPYLHGHWIHTDYGMTWVAYEPWGYRPHHYGRWIWVDGYGWGWAPGLEYGAAWVTWGVADGHIGWAPLAPVWYRYPHRHSYRVRHVPVAYGYGGFFAYDVSGIAFDLWVFVPNAHFYGVNVSVHALPSYRCADFFRGERVLPVGHRIHVDYVRKKTGRRIETVAVDRVIETRGDAKYERRIPRGQEKMIREAQPAVSRVVKGRVGVERSKGTETATTPRTVTRKSDPAPKAGTRTVARSSEPGRRVESVDVKTRKSPDSPNDGRDIKSPSSTTGRVVERKATETNRTAPNSAKSVERKVTETKRTAKEAVKGAQRKVTETKRTAPNSAKSVERKVSNSKSRSDVKDAKKSDQGNSRSSGSPSSSTKSRKR
ncbi:MAG: DUF6600 domain-containing protein [Candidatus Eisenbacteria bacterium]